MVCNQTTYMWQSRQSTRCCDGRWTWSTWRTSRQPPPSPPRRRNGTPHWSSPNWKWDLDQEVKEKQSSFEFWSTHRSFTITTKVPDETSLKEKPHLMKGQNMNPLWTGKCHFAWLLDYYSTPCMEDRRGQPAEPSWRRPTDKKRSVAPRPDLDD